MRVLLAFLCFFRLLFTGKLPASAASYLPEGEAKKLLEAGEAAEAESETSAEGPAERAADVGEARGASAEAEAGSEKGRSGAAKPDGKAAEPAAPAGGAKRAGLAEHHREGALALLSLLQREGRLIDFLREDLAEHDDEAIGAAVRDVHRGLKGVLEEHFSLEAVMPGEEEDRVDVPRGFDPGEIRLIGEANGEPPFKGVLRHHGWRVVEVSFPALAEGVDRRVVAPAEVEVE